MGGAWKVLGQLPLTIGNEKGLNGQAEALTEYDMCNDGYFSTCPTHARMIR